VWIHLSAECPQFPLTSAPCRILSRIWMSQPCHNKKPVSHWSYTVYTWYCKTHSVVLPATTLGVALQTESNGFYFSCSPNMQSEFNYMLSNPLCYIFFCLLVLGEIHTFSVQRLLVSVQCPWKHLWLILPSACIM